MRVSSTGFIAPIDLDDEQESYCSRKLSEARPIIHRWARAVLGDDYSIPQFRRAYASGSLKEFNIPDADKAVINSVRGIAEDYILPGYCRIAVDEINKKDHPQADDLFQEMCLAITDACYGYDGSTKLSTYITNTIKNRMKDVVRRTPLGTITPRIWRLRGQVRRLMQDGTSFETVVADLALDEKTITLVRRAMASCTLDSQRGDEDNDLSLSNVLADTGHEDESHDISPAQLAAAIQQAALTPLERAVIESQMNGEALAEAARRTVNPKTGNPYTRANAGLAWKSAQEKVRRALEHVVKRRAA